MDNEELNYQFILMRHIDRLSQVCTGYMVGNSGNTADMFNPQPISDEALLYGVRFLHAIIPETLLDEEYTGEMDKLADKYNKRINEILRAEKEGKGGDLRNLRKNYDFRCLNKSINLLDRKGLLLPHKIQSTVSHREKKKDEVEVKEVWEDAQA